MMGPLPVVALWIILFCILPMLGVESQPPQHYRPGGRPDANTNKIIQLGNRPPNKAQPHASNNQHIQPSPIRKGFGSSQSFDLVSNVRNSTDSHFDNYKFKLHPESGHRGRNPTHARSSFQSQNKSLESNEFKIEPSNLNFNHGSKSPFSEKSNPTTKTTSWLANLKKLREDSQQAQAQSLLSVDNPSKTGSNEENKLNGSVEQSNSNRKSGGDKIWQEYNAGSVTQVTTFKNNFRKGHASSGKSGKSGNKLPKFSDSDGNSRKSYKSSKTLHNQRNNGAADTIFSENEKSNRYKESDKSLTLETLLTPNPQASDDPNDDSINLPELNANPEPLPKFQALVAPPQIENIQTDQEPTELKSEKSQTKSKYVAETPEWKSFVQNLYKGTPYEKVELTPPPKSKKFQAPKFEPQWKKSEPSLEEIEAAQLPPLIQPTIKYPKFIVPKAEPMWKKFTDEELMEIEREKAERDSSIDDENLLDDVVQSYEEGLKARNKGDDSEDLEANEIPDYNDNLIDKEAEQELYQDLSDYLGDEAKESKKKWYQNMPFFSSIATSNFRIFSSTKIYTFFNLLLLLLVNKFHEIIIR